MAHNIASHIRFHDGNSRTRRMCRCCWILKHFRVSTKTAPCCASDPGCAVRSAQLRVTKFLTRGFPRSSPRETGSAMTHTRSSTGLLGLNRICPRNDCKRGLLHSAAPIKIFSEAQLPSQLTARERSGAARRKIFGDQRTLVSYKRKDGKKRRERIR